MFPPHHLFYPLNAALPRRVRMHCAAVAAWPLSLEWVAFGGWQSLLNVTRGIISTIFICPREL